MAGHPEGDAHWATNPTFVSVGDSWDGDPTKVAPPAGKVDEGWEPTELVPAELLNWWKNKAGEFINYLRLIAVKNWRLVEGAASDGLHAIGYDASTGIYVISGDTGAATTLRSLDGGNTWVAPTTAPGANGYQAVWSDGAGTWVLVGLFKDAYESSDNGDNWTLRTLGAVGASFFDVTFEPNAGAGGLFVAVGANAGDGKIYTSPDGITWTLRHTLVGDGYERIAIDGSGKAVAIASGGTFSTSSDMTAWSDDATFTADAFDDIEFSAGAGLWMIVGDDASATTPFVATSTDGVTFAQVGAAGLPANGTFFEIATDDGFLWLGMNATVNKRLWVSSDAGINWTELTGATGIRFLNVADPVIGGGLRRLEFFARKFWMVGEPGNVWDSLAL